MPIFRAAVDAAEQHILRMHAQDFGTADAPAVAGASPYMADLVRHMSHCRRVGLCRQQCCSHAPLIAAACIYMQAHWASVTPEGCSDARSLETLTEHLRCYYHAHEGVRDPESAMAWLQGGVSVQVQPQPQ